MHVEVIENLAAFDAEVWDRCVPEWDPFCEHRFLALLEESGAVAPQTGWLPVHLAVRDGDEVVGVAPVYVKEHSYGEYIFDWGWASAARRAGIPYYPKLSCAVPFTPATGRRLLVRPGADEGAVMEALLAGMGTLAEKTRSSSIHVLFTTEGEWNALGGRDGLIQRTTHQFHWENDGYDSWEAYLATFRSRDRKKTRKERERAAELGATIHFVRGPDLTDEQWRAMHRFYRNTIGRKGGYPYLVPGWFELARQRLGERLLCVIAEHGGKTVAGALCLQRGGHLYGRYWGSEPDYGRLHFELCYHRPIELCIAEGWSRFEAGAQGSHKLKRGLRPHPTYSLHWLRHAGLHDAVAEALEAEAEWIRQDIAELDAHAPFRRES